MYEISLEYLECWVNISGIIFDLPLIGPINDC